MTRTDLKSVSDHIRSGELLLLVDDVGSRRKAYFFCAAATVTPDQISYVVNHGRGVVCAAISEARVQELNLPPMVRTKGALGIDFTISVESRRGVTTGISASDRAQTLKTLATTKDSKLDLVTPGHIFPIRAKAGGVLVRSDIAEAAVDLLILAELSPVGMLSHCLDEQGELLSDQEVDALPDRLKLSAVSISDVIRFRLSSESIVEMVAEAKLPTSFGGEFRAFCFISRTDHAEHLALVKGDLSSLGADGKQEPVLARVQAENRFSDLLGLDSPPGLERIRAALRSIEARGRGVFVYVRHPRKGNLAEQAAALSRQQDFGGSAGELREHGIGAQILSELGVSRIELLTNSSRDIPGISAFNLEVVGRQPFADLEERA